MKIQTCIDLVENKGRKEALQKLFDFLEKKYSFSDKPAAKSHHHNYHGGLDVHTAEVCECMLKFNNSIAAFKFSLDSLLTVALLHDTMKTYQYEFKKDDKGEEKIEILNFPCSGEAITFRLCTRYGIELTLDEMSAIEFAHGGWSIQSTDRRIQPSQLAYLLHMADLASAQFGAIKKEMIK